MNGHTIKNTSGTVFEIRHKNGYKGTFDLCDCSSYKNDEDVEIGSLSAQGGSAVLLDLDDTYFNMYGGKILDSTTTGNGGVNVSKGTFNMYGGEISGNKADGNGGGVCVNTKDFQKAEFIMSGGEISDNAAKNSGGGVYLFREGSSGTSNSTLNFSLEKGKISNNTAGKDGGGVEIAERYNAAFATTFNMSDGEISDNKANGSGGGVNMSTGTFNITGGKISDNTAEEDGGGIYYHNNYSSSSQCTMSGGEISGNKAKNGGGVSFFTKSGTHFMMSGGKISGNTATYGGGVYCYNSMTMSGSTISGNTAAYGGGIYIGSPNASKSNAYNVGFNMYGNSIISGNTAKEDGGGLYLNPAIKSSTNSTYKTDPNTVIIYGDSKIQNNNAKRGGGIFSYDCGFTIKGNGQILENQAANGGGVFVHQKRKTAIYDDLKVIMTGESVISNNTADANGGGVYLLWEDAAVNPTISNADKTSIEMTMSDNSSISSNNANYGGAVYLNNTNPSYGTVTFKIEGDSTITENTAEENCGGVYNHESVLWLDHSGSIYSNDQCDLYMDYSFTYKNETKFYSSSPVMVIDFNENLLKGEDCEAKAVFAWIHRDYKDIPVEKYFELVEEKDKYCVTILDNGGKNDYYIYIKAKHDCTGDCNIIEAPTYTEEGKAEIECSVCGESVEITLPVLTDEDFWDCKDTYGEPVDQTVIHTYTYTTEEYPGVEVEVSMKERWPLHTAHQACGEENCDHEHAGENIIWMPIWNEDDLLNVFDNGYYYLCDDITLSSCINIKKNITLCLNGFSITQGKAKEYVFQIANKCVLTLCDCSYDEETGEFGGKLTGPYFGVCISSGGRFAMYGGKIEGCQSTGVWVYSGNSTFDMYGGKITGNTTHFDPGGGGVRVNSGTFNMYGGEISGNTADGKGGAVANYGTFNMYGGKISDNKAKDGSSGIYSEGTCTLDGEITINETCGLFLVSPEKLVIGENFSVTDPISVYYGQESSDDFNCKNPINLSTEVSGEIAAAFADNISKYFIAASEIQIVDYAEAHIRIGAHSVSKWEITEDPTQNSTGEATGNCEYCDEKITVEVPELSDEDTWTLDEEKSKDPTPTEPGKYVYTSEEFGEVEIDVPPLNDEDIWTKNEEKSTDPTITEPGKYVYESEEYGEVEINVPPLNDEDIWTKNEEKSTDPTITEPGKYVYESEEYGEVEINVPPLNDEDIWTKNEEKSTDPTITEPGKYVYESEEYGEVEIDVPPLNDEDIWTKNEEKSTDPTITEPGKYVYESEEYGEVEIDVPPLNDEDVWTLDESQHVDPTEDQPGQDVYVSEYGEVIVILPFNPNPDNPDPDKPDPGNPDPDNPDPDNPDPDNPNPDNPDPDKPDPDNPDPDNPDPDKPDPDNPDPDNPDPDNPDPDKPDPDNPDPDNPDPDNPDPDNPDPDKPDPDNPDPDNPDPDNPNPDNPDPDKPDPDNPDPDNPDPDKPDPDNPDPDKPDPDNPDPDNPDPDNPNPDKPNPDNPNPDKPNPDISNPDNSGSDNPSTGNAVSLIPFTAITALLIAVKRKRK